MSAGRGNHRRLSETLSSAGRGGEGRGGGGGMFFGWDPATPFVTLRPRIPELIKKRHVIRHPTTAAGIVPESGRSSSSSSSSSPSSPSLLLPPPPTTFFLSDVNFNLYLAMSCLSFQIDCKDSLTSLTLTNDGFHIEHEIPS